MVWYFSSEQDCYKLDLLNECILPFILKDFPAGENSLLKRAGIANLRNKRVKSMVLTVLNVFFFLIFQGIYKIYFTCALALGRV